jgi:hypothetical protein
MLARILVKRLILSTALLGSLVMLAGATPAKANDHGRSPQFSFSLGIGNGRSRYGNQGFYGNQNRYYDNSYRDYDRYRSFNRDADRNLRRGHDGNWNRNSRFDNNRNGERDRSLRWGRR